MRRARVAHADRVALGVRPDHRRVDAHHHGHHRSVLVAHQRMEVLKRLPGLQKLDGKDVTDDELEAAAA